MAQSPQTPSPPIPHMQPALPGTHVLPQPAVGKSQVLLHIDGPTIVIQQNKDGQRTFNLDYSVINHSPDLANGTVRATFAGSWLAPVGSAKITNLPPGKTTKGAFTARCPARGIFTARLEYGADPSTVQNEFITHPLLAFDTVSVSCR